MRQTKYFIPVAAMVVGSIAYACQVPVFRYALERWPADNYEFVVIHDGPVTESQKLSVGQLVDLDHRSVLSANFSVRYISTRDLKDPALKKAWADHSQDGQPVLASLYPRTAQEVPDRLIDAGPLRTLKTNYFSDSPVRQKIAERLVSGESAVWIFVPCGKAEQDAKALIRLTNAIKSNEESLELPEQDEIEEEQELLEQVDIELRLDFSILTLDRKDPKEQFLLKMLLASEPDLEGLDQPMAFPVLGRGRVLYALVGKGISEETVSLASRFIIGPCSCQVKNQNPGFDLLMACDWDEKIGKAKLSDPLPENDGEPVLLTIPPGR